MHELSYIWFSYFWSSLKGNGPEAAVQTVSYGAIAYAVVPPFRRWVNGHFKRAKDTADSNHVAATELAQTHHEALLAQSEEHHEEALRLAREHHAEHMAALASRRSPASKPVKKVAKKVAKKATARR